MATTSPPTEVMIGFLRQLALAVDDFEVEVCPVLRGSLLMKQWFGDEARPAADIDLECFERRRSQPEEDDESSERVEGRYGPYGEYESLVAFGKAVCRYAAEYFGYEIVNGVRRNRPIRFTEVDTPSDGHSLWTYGTPGERYYTGWNWNGTPSSGVLQLDIAEAAAYRMDDLAIEPLRLVSMTGEEFTFPSYSPEMLLAAKLSWFLRGFQREETDGVVTEMRWTGEAKDFFDVHLLLTHSRLELRGEVFRKSLLAVGTSDKMNWNDLDQIFDVRRVNVTPRHFSTWDRFRKDHSKLVREEPQMMLQQIADRLEPLLGDFYLAEEMPFLLAINDQPFDEATYLIYADWLEERNLSRGAFLRLLAQLRFREGELSRKELTRLRGELATEWKQTSIGWLCQLFSSQAQLTATQMSMRTVGE
jgi:uncharacterized protein (TIGR02996 family)